MTWTLPSRFSMLATLAALGGLTLVLPSPASAQDRPLVTPDDYGRWERLGVVEFSPFGEWIAYVVTRVDEKSELRVRKLEEDSVRIFPWGSAPRFSPDGRWLAWTIGLPPEERERLEESDAPIREKASVMDLQTGETREFDVVSEQRFDASGSFVALRGYPPDEPSGKGADLRIITLATGTETTFGNVGEMAWSPTGSLLALAIATGTDVGNGVQVYAAAAGTLRSADASGSAYRSLRWRHDSTDLAALRSSDATSADGTAYDVLAWRDLDRRVKMMVLGASAAGIPDTLETVRHRAPAWSDDGTMISLGLRPIEEEEDEDPGDGAEDEPGAAPSDDLESEDPESEDAPASDSEPDLPALQIWHTGDVRLFPEQQVSEGRDGTRSLLAVWHLDDDRVVVLGSDLMGSAQLLDGWVYALEDIDEPYPWGAMFGRPYHDVRAIATGTGERRQVLTRVRYEWPSAGGDWLLSWDGAAYHSLHIATGAKHDVTSELAAEFADTDYDTPTDVTPPRGFGPGGWLEGDNAVLLYDEHDVWRVAPDGSGGERLTRGAETGITHRLTRVTDDDDEPGLDPDSRPYLSLYNEKTEQRGYARFTSGWLDARDRDSAEILVLQDAYVGGLVPRRQRRRAALQCGALRRPTGSLRRRPRPRRPRPGDRDQPLHRRGGVGPGGAGRLRERIGPRPSVRPPPSREPRGGQRGPHDRVHLRDPLPADAPLRGPQRTGLLQLHGLDPAWVRGAAAGHRVPGAGSGGECAGVRERGRGEGRRDGSDGPGRGRPHRALVGRLSGDVPAHADRHLRGFRGGRAAHGLRELHGRAALEPGSRRAEPLGDRPGSHGGAVLGGIRRRIVVIRRSTRYTTWRRRC